MSTSKIHAAQHQNVTDAFSRQSSSFDAIEIENPIVIWMRIIIRAHLVSQLKKDSHILELNAGTGLDAVYLAQQGFTVHATDNAPGMLNELEKKITANNLQQKISLQQCSFEQLSQLYPNKYNHIFSNFGGLNCAPDLAAVLAQFNELLPVGGRTTLVIMPPFCAWEFLFFLKGNFKLAFRRFKKKGAVSHLEGKYFLTYYYSPRYIQRALRANFKTVKLQGIGVFSPPPFMEKWAKKFPRMYRFLTKMDELFGHLPLLRACCDHYIITLEKIK